MTEEVATAMTGSIYKCKNHQTLRWFDTKPGGALVFMGELVPNTEPTKPKLKEPAYECGNPLRRLKHYLNNRNPYSPDRELDEPYTYERLKEYMQYVFKMEELGMVFECECPGSALERVEGETYEQLRWSK